MVEASEKCEVLPSVTDNKLKSGGVTLFDNINDGWVYFCIQKYVERLLDYYFGVDRKLGNGASVTNFAISNVIKKFKLPIISINNNDLIRMITDTDLEIEFNPYDVKLPFENFLLKFMLDGNVVELFINKTSTVIKGNEIEQIIIFGQGVIVYPDGEFGQIGVQIAGDCIFEYDKHDEEEFKLRERIINFVRKLIYYFSIEKTKQYIDIEIRAKEKSNKPRSIRESRYGVSIINLFHDVQYRYEQSKDDELSSKVAHLVRGHFRKQPFGKRESPEFKIIWIQPYFTGADLPTDNKKYSLLP